MGNLGLGVMIQALAGYGDDKAALLKCAGKTIDNVRMDGDHLLMDVAELGTLRLYDDGQSCCENRYMRTDDDLPSFDGATLIDVEVRDAPDVEDDGEVHEVAFLVVHTSKGDLTCSTHNEHDGYYGGFAIRAKLVSP